MAFPMALILALLALLAVCKADDNSPPTPTITTAPIFIPYYSEDQWSAVRGSIISTVGLPGADLCLCAP